MALAEALGKSLITQEILLTELLLNILEVMEV